MSTTRTSDKMTEVEYHADPVRVGGKVIALKITKSFTITKLGSTGERKRGSRPEFAFTDVGVIDINDVADLTGVLTGALVGALHDLERGLV